MSEAKHTPGPWTVALARDENIPLEDHRIVADGRIIASVDNRAFRYGEGLRVTDRGLAEGVANAHLMAASPEMLAALRDFVTAMEKWGDWDEGCFYYGGKAAPELRSRIKSARAAIAKAEGRQ